MEGGDEGGECVPTTQHLHPNRTIRFDADMRHMITKEGERKEGLTPFPNMVKFA